MASSSTPESRPPCSAPAVTATTAPRVMLLSVWTDDAPGARWHARLVQPDASAQEFHSPFDLVQFLAQAWRSPAEFVAGSDGIR